MMVILTNIPTPYRTPFFNTLNEELKKNGIKFHVLYCAKNEPNRQWDFNEHDQRYPYTILKGLHFNFKSFYPHVNFSIIKKIKDLKPRWLLIAGAWNTPTMMFATNSWLTGSTTRIFWSEGHSDAVRYSTGIVPKLRERILSKFNAFAVPNQRSFDFIREDLKLKKPILLLPNCVKEEFFIAKHESEKAEIRKKLGISLEKKIILQVSQLEDRKGVRELVRGYLKLKEDYLETSMLVIIGEGSLKKEIISMISSGPKNCSILLTGNQNLLQVRDWMIASNAFILATKRDPNPLTPIEASFAGLPLLLSRKAGNFFELLIDGKNGIPIETIDEETVFRALDTFLSLSINKMNQMGKISFTNAMDRFQRKNIAQNFIRQLLDEQNKL